MGNRVVLFSDWKRANYWFEETRKYLIEHQMDKGVKCFKRGGIDLSFQVYPDIIVEFISESFIERKLVGKVQFIIEGGEYYCEKDLDKFLKTILFSKEQIGIPRIEYEHILHRRKAFQAQREEFFKELEKIEEW